MALTKQAGTWRYEDLLELPDNGRRYEIIDGELYEMPSPNYAHASVVTDLILLLAPVVLAMLGKIRTAPLDVFFRGADPVQPDILVLLPDRLALISERGIEGPPNLVVEVLSPSNPRHDTVRKRALYARGGVPEYWIVDPEARSIEVLVLDGGDDREYAVVRGDARVASLVLPALSFPAEAAFAGIPTA